MRKKSKPPYSICGVNCWEFGCTRSPPEVLEANQKMWAERFAEPNRNNHRNTRRRELRRKIKSDQEKQEHDQEQRRKQINWQRDLCDVGPIGGSI